MIGKAVFTHVVDGTSVLAREMRSASQWHVRQIILEVDDFSVLVPEIWRASQRQVIPHLRTFLP
jgi:hypothetical protein